jgi:hypothetical protein
MQTTLPLIDQLPHHLEQLMLQSHITLRLQTNTSPENVSQSSSLLSKSVDDWCSWWSQWSLEHVTKDTEDAVEVSKVLGGGTVSGVSLPLDTGHHLSDNDKIDDQWRCEERVFANVEEGDGLVTAHEDLGIVLIQSTLVVSNSWHVLDDNSVIWVLSWCVKDRVCLDHIVNYVGLGDLLGSELLLRAEVLSIIVTEVVVTGNGSELDTSADQEIDKSRFHLGLSRLEIITTNEGVVFLGELNGTWNESVLWRSVDERSAFENGSNSKDSGWSNFFVSLLDSLHQVVGSVVDTVN